MSAQIDKEESVEDLLANADHFIEGVYRELGVSPRRSVARESKEQDSSSLSITTSPGGAPTNLLKSPITRRNMDAEIERINQFCDNIDRNLRSVGLIMNNSFSNSVSEDPSNTHLSSPPSTSRSIPSKHNTRLYNFERYAMPKTLNPFCPPLSQIIRNTIPENNAEEPETPTSSTGEISNSVDQSASSQIEEDALIVIDLSDSQTHTPEIQRQPVQRGSNNINDDDVILVSTNIPPLVNLCTPDNSPTIFRREHTASYNGRRSVQYDYDFTCKGSLSTKKRRISNKPTQNNKPSDNANEKPANLTTSPDTNSNSRTAYMCPVCMEPCMQRYPTSTVCGHVFCELCIIRAINVTKKCPMCNKKINSKQIFRIYL